jgi:hypothetical protein
VFKTNCKINNERSNKIFTKLSNAGKSLVKSSKLFKGITGISSRESYVLRVFELCFMVLREPAFSPSADLCCKTVWDLKPLKRLKTKFWTQGPNS